MDPTSILTLFLMQVISSTEFQTGYFLPYNLKSKMEKEKMKKVPLFNKHLKAELRGHLKITEILHSTSENLLIVLPRVTR